MNNYVLIECGLIHKYLIEKSDIEILESTTFFKVTILKEFENVEIEVIKDGLILKSGNEIYTFKMTSDPVLSFYLDGYVNNSQFEDTPLIKCNDCKYCLGTVCGDIEEFECSKGYYKKFKLNVETNCKGFKSRNENIIH